MKWIIAIASSFLFNAILILRGRGSFLATIITLGSSFWIGLPLLILSGVIYSVASRKNNTLFIAISSSGIVAAFVIFSTLLTIPIGSKLVNHDVRKAKAFCEALGPQLERIKEQTGNYPKDISGVLDGLRPPHLFVPRWYHCDGTNYSFTIADPDSIMGDGHTKIREENGITGIEEGQQKDENSTKISRSAQSAEVGCASFLSCNSLAENT